MKLGLNIVADLLKKSIDKFKKAVSSAANSKYEEVMDPFIKFQENLNELMNDHSFIGLLKFFVKMSGAVNSAGKKATGALDKLEDAAQKKIEEMKRKMMQKIAKILLKIMKVVIKALAKLIMSIIHILIPWGLVIILVIVCIYAFIMLFPSLMNLFSFSYGFNKADYYDTELFQAVKNKETMLENVYERTAETSFYQRFADSEIDDFLGLLVPNLESEMTNYGKTYKEAAKDAQSGFTGFYTMDERMTAHDANFNPMQDILQANTIDTTNENKATMQGYFRDLFDKEVNFMLSEQFLRQANTYVQNMGIDYNNQIVYPEMFTKPIAYVTDFNRIDLFTDVKDNKLQYVWKDYTYTTKRILKDDVGQDLGNVVRNINELDWASHYGVSASADKEITATMEGQIASWPSPYVWENAVLDKDFYKVYDDGTDTSIYHTRGDFVDNDYNSEYLTFINDKTGEVEQVRFYYKLTGTVKENGEETSDAWTVQLQTSKLDTFETEGWEGIGEDFIAWLLGDDKAFEPIQESVANIKSFGLLGDTENYSFEGPYVGVLNETYSDSVTTTPSFINDSCKVTESADGVWYIINIPEGYRLPEDVPAIYVDADGNELFQEREINEVKIRKIFNPGPSKHVQTVQLTDNNSNLAVSSQNLINYKYYKIKTVSEGYRNQQAYIDGWADWIQDNSDDLAAFSDRDMITMLSRRIFTVGKTISDSIIDAVQPEEPTDLENYTFEDVELYEEDVDAEDIESNSALINFTMEFPPETLALSLYLYEKNLVATQPENEVWKWDYSVNNYFKTDNKKMEGYEFYQKYYYIYEEAKLSQEYDSLDIPFDKELSILAKEYNSSKPWWDIRGETNAENLRNQIIKEFTTNGTLYVNDTIETTVEKGITGILGAGAFSLNPATWVISAFDNAKSFYFKITGKEVNQQDLNDFLEKMSALMSTSYVNLGTVRKTQESDIAGTVTYEGFADYIPNYNTMTAADKQFIIGTDIYGNDRGGEGSLLSTFAINEKARESAIIYSARNSGIVEISDIETSLTFNTDSEKLQNAWEDFKSIFTGEIAESNYVGEHSFDFTIIADEHDHYQYEYYIDEDISDTYRSGVFDSSGNGMENELPLEVQSVRDYGLGSILNYVDSLTVEFYSGAWYDEVYLKNEIGEAIITEYPDIYSTYSYLNNHDDYFNITDNSIDLIATKTTEDGFKSATSIVGSGYYPKEMKQLASDKIVELFEQNNKKKLFEQLVNAIDGKIFEVSYDYDEALWNEEKNNTLVIDDKSFDLTDISTLDETLDGVKVQADAVTDSMNGVNLTFRLEHKLRDTDKINTNNEIKFHSDENPEVDLPKDYYIYRVNDGETHFYYYMPEILYPNGDAPSKVAQLLIPKRYYRSWVQTLSLLDDNGEDWNDKVSEMSQLDLLRTIILKKTVLVDKERYDFLKTYDATLPKTNLDAVIKGIGDTYFLDSLKYKIASGAELSIYDNYAGYHRDILFKTDESFIDDELNPWQMAEINNDSQRLLENQAKTTELTYLVDDKGDDDPSNDEYGGGRTLWYTNRVGELSETKPANDKLYDVEGNEIVVKSTGGEKNYYQFLLDTYSSDNFKGCINRFDFITDNDVAKVFVIDEAATFTGKFMYTYKDTLLSTGDVLDLETSKGVLSAYATDRYIFLDSWDIKLLTERVIDVSFMFMNTEFLVDEDGEKTVSEYIEYMNEKAAENTESNVLETIWNSIKQKVTELLQTLLGIVDEDFTTNKYEDIYSNCYIYAIPESLIDDIKNWSGSSDFKWKDEGIRKEIEDYSNMIFSGFLFQESAAELGLLTPHAGSSSSGLYGLEYDLLSNSGGKIEYFMNMAALEGISAGGPTDVTTVKNKVSSYVNAEKIEAEGTGNPSLNFEALDSLLSYFDEFQDSSYSSPCFYPSGDANDLLVKIVTDSLEPASTLSSIHESYESNLAKIEEQSANLTAEQLDSYKEGLYMSFKAEMISFISYMSEYTLDKSYEEEFGIVYADKVNSQFTYTFKYLSEPEDISFWEGVVVTLANLTADITGFLNDTVTGFKVTSDSSYSLCMSLDTKDTADMFRKDGRTSKVDYYSFMANYLEKLQNKYVKILGHKHEGNSSFNGIPYDYEITYYDGEKGPGSNGVLKCHAALYTYTLKCSDEIANRVEKGRYYSMFSNIPVGSFADVIESSEFTNNLELFKEWSMSDDRPNLETSKAYGELITVNSNTLLDLFEEVYTDDVLETTINGQIVNLKYEDIWRPQVKLFDNVRNLPYTQETMKEILYGVYFKEDGTRNDAVDVPNGVLSGNSLKSGLQLTRVVDPAETNESNLKHWFLHFLGTYCKNRKFLSNTFDMADDDGNYILENSLKGFSLEEEVETKLFHPDLETNKEEDMFLDKSQDVYLIDDNQKYAINPVELLNDEQKNKLIELLNKEFKDEVKTIINSGDYAVAPSSSEQYAITGFVLVPRFADRRDEPTLYPTYRYYGGSKKQIIPEEKIKYFEGLTYDSWKAKMTIDENDTEDAKDIFNEEMHRLSNYLYSYFENFEAYVPYNVVADSDLEVRGTAGYADLLTSYTLYPTRTLNYTNVFVSEAGKSYWSDLCTAYDIPRTVIAQLLQGMAETRLSTIAEDNVALMVQRGWLDEYKEEYVAEINSLLMGNDNTLFGYKNDEAKKELDLSIFDSVSLNGHPLPIVGICALDDFPDKDLGEVTEEDYNENSPDATGMTMNQLLFIGSAGNAQGFSDSSRNIVDVRSDNGDLISLIDSIPEGTTKIAFMPSVIDVVETGNNAGNIDTMYARNFLNILHKKFPDAELYYLPINPVVASVDGEGNYVAGDSYSPSGSNFSTAFDMNEAIASFNYRMQDFCNECLDGSVTYLDYISDVAGENGLTLNSEYADTDKHSLNSEGWAAVRNSINDILKELEEKPEFKYKDTKYYNPISGDIKDYEVSLRISGYVEEGFDEESYASCFNEDERFNIEKSVQYMSVKLYKNAKSLGDLLKGVYASFYGEKFVKALVAVTDDNAINLAEDPDGHGLWYRPTNNDLTRALNKLNDDTKEYFNWREQAPFDELREVYGIDKLQKSFSYIKDMDYRKILVTYAMNSNGGLGNLTSINIGDLEGWDIGIDSYVNRAKGVAEGAISGKSLITGQPVNSVRMIDYIATVCNQFSTEKSPMDPALVLALIMHESGGNPKITQYGGGLGRGLAQHSVPTGLSATAETVDGVKKSIFFPYNDAFDPIASIDYIIMNFAQKMQEASYEMHPFTALRTHNLPTTLTARLDFTSSPYELNPEGDLQYIYDYETGNNYAGYHQTMSISGSSAARAAAASEAEYKAALASNENFGFSDPKYITHILAYYVEEYANGDLLNSTLSASNKRDYSEEIWEEEYMKYQNSGVQLISANLPASDIDILVQMTANYRNNNTEQDEYGYTYLDFFKDVNKVDSGENEFTGEMGDSLILNAMTYLGAHYSQGLASRPQDYVNGMLYDRLSNAENLGGNVYETPFGKIYEEGTTHSGNKYAFDCSSFGGQMYLAMGYNIKGSTCSSIRSSLADTEVHLGNVRTVGIENLKPGDLLVSPTHTIIWVGQSYTSNYNNLFNPSTLRVYGNQIIKRSGTEVLSWANSNVKENAYIHSGGYKPGGSCVNIKEGSISYLSRFDVYRFFRDDIDYNQTALESVDPNLCPTIFTSTTIKNNPYLVEYMENSGILETEMAKGKFTAADVALAKSKIAEVRGEALNETEAEEAEEEQIGVSKEDTNKKDTGYYW